jgi:hypothetical protein
VTTGSDNPYPKVIVVEGSAPASPAAGRQALFIDTADHHLKRKNSGGTVTDLETGGGGGSSLTVDDEGTPLATAATTLDFVGAGVTASGTGATKTITIPGGGGSGEFLQTSKVQVTSGDITTTSTTFVDLTGLTTTITTGAHRCIVIFNASGRVNSPTNALNIDIAIDGTRQGQSRGLLFGGNTNSVGANPFSLWYLTGVLSAASHTIKIQWSVDSGGTATMFASTSVTPAILTVIETSQTT